MAGPRITQNRILRVLPQPLSSNGTKLGRITTPSSHMFMVGQIVRLTDNQGKNEEYQVKRIVDHFMYLGAKGKGINDRADLTSWLTANAAEVSAIEQERPKTPIDQIEYFMYAEEPINAERNVQVDLLGKYVDPYTYGATDRSGGTLPGGLPAQRSQGAPPFGYQFIANIIDKFIGDLTYNKVENSVEGDLEILTFRNNDAVVKEIHLRYTGVSWIIVDPDTNILGGNILLEAEEGYLLTEDGDRISVLA